MPSSEAITLTQLPPLVGPFSKEGRLIGQSDGVPATHPLSGPDMKWIANRHEAVSIYERGGEETSSDPGREEKRGKTLLIREE